MDLPTSKKYPRKGNPLGYAPVGTAEGISLPQPVPSATAPLRVSTLAPVSGPYEGGTSITIRGAGLSNVTDVQFKLQLGSGRASATDITKRKSPSGEVYVTCKSPAYLAFAPDPGVNQPQQAYIRVVAGPSQTSLEIPFTYILAEIDSISPAYGPIGGGTHVVLRSKPGKPFSQTTSVSFGSTSAPVPVVVNADGSALACYSPAHAAGAVSVRVSPGRALSTVEFTYRAAPHIDSITPAYGPPAGGTDVVIAGSGFGTYAVVYFGPNSAVGAFCTDTSISTRSLAGTGTVQVKVRAYEQDSDNTVPFTYVLPPEITSLDPASGDVAGGYPVSIHGSGFTVLS